MGDSLEHLYRTHCPWLRNWLYQRLGNSSQAAEFAHDVFVRLLGVQRTSGSLPELQQPRAYLATVGRHLLHDHFRRQSLEKAYLETLAQLPEPVARSSEELALLHETLDALDRLLDRMRPLVRQTFLLSQLDGLGYAQIARQLGIGERSVKRYMAQAFEACILYLD